MIKHGAISSLMKARFATCTQYKPCFRFCLNPQATTRKLSNLFELKRSSRPFILSPLITAMGKAKRKSVASVAQVPQTSAVPTYIPPLAESIPPPPKRRASQRTQAAKVSPSRTNPDTNADVLDGPEALRASPDAEEKDERLDFGKVGVDASKQIKDEDNDVPSLTGGDSGSSLSEMSDMESPVKQASGKNIPSSTKVKAEVMKRSKEPQFLDPEAEGEEEADEEEIQAALSRPPPVNSDYLPLPWKGRLGYVSSQSYIEFYRLIVIRLVFVPTYVFRTLRYLAQGPAESLP